MSTPAIIKLDEVSPAPFSSLRVYWTKGVRAHSAQGLQ